MEGRNEATAGVGNVVLELNDKIQNKKAKVFYSRKTQRTQTYAGVRQVDVHAGLCEQELSDGGAVGDDGMIQRSGVAALSANKDKNRRFFRVERHRCGRPREKGRRGEGTRRLTSRLLMSAPFLSKHLTLSRSPLNAAQPSLYCTSRHTPHRGGSDENT